MLIREKRRKLFAIASLLFVGVLAGAGIRATSFQTPSQKAERTVRSLRLYVFDCGSLKSGNPAPLLERGITTTDMSVAAFLIVSPHGTLLWDTGVIPDDLIQPGGTTELRATVKKTLV